MSVRRHARVVSLWVHPGQEAAFEAFEREASRRMARHGGRIDAAVRTAPANEASAPGQGTAFEVHVVSFPDEAAARAYDNDPETIAARGRRAAIVAMTIAVPGREAGPY